MWPRPSSEAAGGRRGDGPGPGAAIRGAPKLITRPRQRPFRCEYGTSHCNEPPILLISTAPLYAQRQRQDVAKLKADAQKVVSIISGDEAKTQDYCEASDTAKQIVQAGQRKDNEKVEEADKLTEQQKNLGSKSLALMKSLREANLTSKDGQEIESMFDSLDESCPH
jgi:hypothetical protein